MLGSAHEELFFACAKIRGGREGDEKTAPQWLLDEAGGVYDFVGGLERGGAGYRVALVFDGEGRVAAEANPAFRFVFGREPEIIDLLVFVIDFAFLDPEGGAFRWLCFDAGDGEVLGVNPDFTAVEIFVVGFRDDVEDVLRGFGGIFEGSECEIVVFGV